MKCLTLWYIFNLKFIHAGHKSKISDLSWNINDKLMIASVEDDNIL
jgi:histone-binding protein RBBP4